MATYLVFSRREYAEPLEHLDTVEIAGDHPRLEQVPRGDEGWLELVLVPDDAITWVLRGGDLVAAEEAGR